MGSSAGWNGGGPTTLMLPVAIAACFTWSKSTGAVAAGTAGLARCPVELLPSSDDRDPSNRKLGLGAGDV